MQIYNSGKDFQTKQILVIFYKREFSLDMAFQNNQLFERKEYDGEVSVCNI